MKALYEIFSYFEFCRKLSGGTWYKIYEEYTNSGGYSSSATYWTQNEIEESHGRDSKRKIIKTEKYD